MTMQDDTQAYEHKPHEDEPEGAAAKRKTLITTGITGTAGTLIGLASHGPVGLFFGVLGTAAALALEGHGTPEEYAAMARSLGPAFRWVMRQQAHPQDDRSSLHAAPIGREEPASEMEASHPRTPHLVPPKSGGETARLSPASSFFMLSDVLWRGFVPSLDRLYLATLDDGTEVYVPANRLCHVALAGATRGGKGHLKRSLMAQLCYAGAEIYLLDPHYTRWDRESRDPLDRPCPEDWTPYTPYLQNDPTELIPVRQKYCVIGNYLRAATQELDRRIERYGNSLPVGTPVFLFLDELPDIVDNIPEAEDCLKKLLRQGAKVGVNVVTLSQDFLVDTLFPKGGGGAVRDCYRTVLYVGGDATTARVLLDMPAKDVPEHELGRGRVMVRCDVVRPAAKGRVPYADNPAIYALLGPSTYVPTDEENQAGGPSSPLSGPHLRPAASQAPRRGDEVHDAPFSVPEPRQASSAPRLYHTHGVGREAQRARVREREWRLRTRGEAAAAERHQPSVAVPETPKPAPTLQDAIAIWNAAVNAGEKLSRYSLKDKLVAQGFECGENMARKFLEEIKALVEHQQSDSVHG